MWFVSLLFLIPIVYLLYYRYVPVKGVKCMNWNELVDKEVIIDLRDYNDSTKGKIAKARPLPIAYIKRHHHDLPKQGLYLIASNTVEKNLGIRLLQRYGYKVMGYTLINNKCCCKKRLTKLA